MCDKLTEMNKECRWGRHTSNTCSKSAPSSVGVSHCFLFKPRIPKCSSNDQFQPVLPSRGCHFRGARVAPGPAFGTAWTHSSRFEPQLASFWVESVPLRSSPKTTNMSVYQILNWPCECVYWRPAWEGLQQPAVTLEMRKWEQIMDGWTIRSVLLSAI